jgi:hypothetical protein
MEATYLGFFLIPDEIDCILSQISDPDLESFDAKTSGIYATNVSLQ